ncbi:MAG: radical SAM protein [Oscillospiraceae bacterium]|nr:radical SAM protein [Oscillospiraceae bacterium]
MTLPHCALCPRRCGARRDAMRGEGRCGVGALPVVARAALHFGEEPCITGTRGSGTVFFCGCPLHCAYCQNADISENGAHGRVLTVDELGAVFQRLAAQGAHNINLVTAGHFLPAVAEALRRYPPGIPVVYNSSGYETMEALRLLEGLVDVYLPDFKYADADLAALLSDAPDYPEVALAAIAEMRRQTGAEVIDEDGIMRRGTLVRHLVLPGLSGASMRALAMLRDALPPDVRISLMGQYTPQGRAAAMPGLDRPLSAKAYRMVAAQMRALGFDGYLQSPKASGTAMIPAWDGTGLS